MLKTFAVVASVVATLIDIEPALIYLTAGWAVDGHIGKVSR